MNKRIAAREWKRKRNQQRLIFRLSVVAVCVVALLGVGYIAWDLWSRTYVMTFDGQRIGTGDMSFFAMFADGTMDPRAQALEQLTQSLLVDKVARHHNISLSASEVDELQEELGELRGMFEMFGMSMPNITNERMVELLSMELLSERLMEYYTANLAIDEAEFEASLAEFLMFGRGDFFDMEFRYFFSDNPAYVDAAHAELLAASPEQFDEIILRNFEITTGIEIEDPEPPVITLSQLRTDPSFDQMFLGYLSSLQLGEVSEPILIENDFIIFIVDRIDDPSDEELTEIFRERHIMEQRWSFFIDVMDSWREATQIEINQRGVNAA